MSKEEFAMLLESILLLLDSGKVEEVKQLIRKRLKSIDGDSYYSRPEMRINCAFRKNMIQV